MSNEKGIIRAQRSKDRPYFPMARATAQDRDISFEARGMLAYFLSKPDDWQIRISDLCQECGKNRVYRIIKELLENGYMERTYQRDAKGKITEVSYTVYEVKCPFPQNPQMDNQEMENPFVDNQPLHKLELDSDTEINKKPRKRLDFAHIPTDTLIDAYYSSSGKQSNNPHTQGNRALCQGVVNKITPDDVRAYVEMTKGETWRNGKPVSLKEVMENTPAWIQNRARSNGHSGSNDQVKSIRDELQHMELSEMYQKYGRNHPQVMLEIARRQQLSSEGKLS